MRSKLLLTVFLTWVTIALFAQSSSQRQKLWTIAEVKTWVEKNKNYSTWHGWILYQGSDTLHHYFISRITDNWQWFRIKRSDLELPEEHVYKQTSSAPLGYYYVDPLKDFRKVKDYQ